MKKFEVIIEETVDMRRDVDSDVVEVKTHNHTIKANHKEEAIRIAVDNNNYCPWSSEAYEIEAPELEIDDSLTECYECGRIIHMDANCDCVEWEATR